MKDPKIVLAVGACLLPAVLVLVVAGCSGGSDEAGTEASSSPTGAETETSAAGTETSSKNVRPQGDDATPKPRRLIGTWSAMGDRVLFRFRRDGTFAVDRFNLDEPYAAGTYQVSGRTIRFTSNGPICVGTWTWKAGIAQGVLGDELGVVVVKGGCGAATGKEWTFARIS